MPYNMNNEEITDKKIKQMIGVIKTEFETYLSGEIAREEIDGTRCFSPPGRLLQKVRIIP